MTTAESRPPVSPGERLPTSRCPPSTGGDRLAGRLSGPQPPLPRPVHRPLVPLLQALDRPDGSHPGQAGGRRGRVTWNRGDDPRDARLYFKYRPTRLRLGADPKLSTHRAYGLPKPEATPELMRAIETTRINPDAAFPEALPIQEAAMALARADGYTGNEMDKAEMERQWPQLKGQFLIDRDGIVRWANVECATEGFAGMGKFPSVEEILSAARAL